MENKDQNNLPPLDSLDGPGNHKPLKITGDIKSVARLSKKTKGVLFVTAAMVVTGIVVGTMTAGHHAGSGKQAAGQNSDSAADTVGTVTPDAAISKPVHVKAATGNGNNGNGGNGSADNSAAAADASAVNGPLTPRGTAASGSTPADKSAMQTGQATAPTPEQQYRSWLKQQHYKRLEGSILAADEANTAEISSKGMQQTAKSPKTGSDSNLQDAQAAALKLMANNPKAAQSPDMQKLLQSLAAGKGGSDEPGQKDNNQFVANAQQNADDGYLASLEQPKASENELFAGSIIPAVLVSAINSDLPGTISAMVRQTVYDSLHPSVILIPQGTKLVGEYSSDVAFGQKRVLAVWDRMIFPNGATINLKGMLGADGEGRSGLNDQVDNHYLQTFGSAILISLLGVAAQLSQPQTGGALTTPPASAEAAGAMAAGMNQASTMVLEKNLHVQPTLEIRPGYTFNVMVNKTIIMPPYQDR